MKEMIQNIIVFILGLIVGSFLNCVIYRLEEKKSFLKGRSYCPSCKHNLSPSDLVPVLSYIFLGGKCRYCKKVISIQYPVVELITAFLFLLTFNPDHIVRSIYLLVSISLLIVISVFDLKHYIIPDKVVLPATVLAIAYNLFLLITGDITGRIFLNYLYAGLLPAFFFFALFFISKGRWLGFGDVKLVLYLGLLLGPEKTIVALFLAFLFGGIIGLGLITLGKKNFKSEIPFGPFLITGAILALFWGKNLITWYLNLVIK